MTRGAEERHVRITVGAEGLIARHPFGVGSAVSVAAPVSLTIAASPTLVSLDGAVESLSTGVASVPGAAVSLSDG